METEDRISPTHCRSYEIVEVEHPDGIAFKGKEFEEDPELYVINRIGDLEIRDPMGMISSGFKKVE